MTVDLNIFNLGNQPSGPSDQPPKMNFIQGTSYEDLEEEFTTVDSGSKALEFLGLQQDEQVDSSSSAFYIYFLKILSFIYFENIHNRLKDIPVVIMSSENVPSSINRLLTPKNSKTKTTSIAVAECGGFIYYARFSSRSGNKAKTIDKVKEARYILELDHVKVNFQESTFH
ncbi:uncharacterized protein LOC109846291 [Asparagus officinalis]|uniref:uncharacterized protein LOC109846291 n=1 Tax=Asparagus officinalis TaxID=4686 RepID=UPI00098E757F|nr:uncharacterized protein LOC109846291 [Asparagus officinalis]